MITIFLKKKVRSLTTWQVLLTSAVKEALVKNFTLITMLQCFTRRHLFRPEAVLQSEMCFVKAWFRLVLPSKCIVIPLLDK